MRKKIIAIEQDFEKIRIYITGKDNFLHTRVIETDVYDLAELLINKNKDVMSDKKVYILQKPTIKSLGLNECIVKAGTEVKQRETIYVSADGWCFSRQFVETSPEWFLPKEEEKPTVVDWSGAGYTMYFKVRFGGDVPDKEFEIPKERLAEILIAESKGDLNLNGNTRIKFQPIESSDPDFNRYNEKELIEAEEKAFNMARSVYPHKYVYAIKDWQYKTFSDYKNQQSNK